MASDNEDDDLEALRSAALASIRQKEQPIQKVISSVTSSRSHSSPQWSDIPASLDFPEFADPIPEAGPNPLPYSGIRGSHPGGNIRQPAPQFSILRPIQNGMPHPSHPFQYGFRPEQRNFPRFPRQSFGNRQDRGNGRLNRQFLPHHGSRRGAPPGGFHVHRHDHPSNQPQPPANLIFIQPGGDGPASSSKSSLHPPAGPKHNNANVPTHRPAATDSGKRLLSLPQDKYHSSRGVDNGSSSTPAVSRTDEADAPEEVKSKDKFSRYDKSDSEEEEEDLSEVDDIANEIDKVLQDDPLGEQQEEESGGDLVEEPGETETSKEPVSDDDQPATASPEQPVKSASPAAIVGERDLADDTSSISELESDSESLDLDALAGGEPILGDLEDLDSLVDKEPNGAVVKNNNKNVVGSGDWDENSSVPSSKVPDTDKKCDDEDIEKDVLNINVEDDSFIANNETDIMPDKPRHKSDVAFSSVRQSPQRRLSRSPTYLGRGALSPRRPDAYRNPHSPPRSRSPFYTKRRSSVSPRRSPLRRSRSPYYKSALRRSVSPRRRMPDSNVGQQRRFRSPLRNFPDVRRRGISPRRRSMSPGGRVRSRERLRERTDDRGNHFRDGERERLNRDTERERLSRDTERQRLNRDTERERLNRDTERERLNRDTERERLNRDRSRPQERDKLERQPTSVNSSQPEKSAKGVDRKSPPRKRVSPLLNKEPVVDLESLTPEERAKIEARGRKFDGRKEVKLTEVDTKTISLKSIKSREKKQKKKVKSDGPSKKEDRMPVVDKKPMAAGISLKKLRKKQEMKKTQEEVNTEKNSPQAVSLADLNDDSEDSEDGRSWKKESTSVTELRIRMPRSQPLPRDHHRSMPSMPARERPSVKARRQVDTRRQEKPSPRDRRKTGRVENSWSTDEDDANVGTGSLRSSAVVSSKTFEPDVPPDQLRIQLQIAPQKNKSKKKQKAHPDFSNVYSLHVKRQHEAVANNNVVEEEEEEVPAKKMKKKKEKKKKHSKEREAHASPTEEEEETSAMSPTKLSIMERLGKKVDLSKALDKKEKKKRKRNRSAEEEGKTTDLDLHMMKMKEKNKKILQRQREIQLDKERYA